MPQQGLLWVNSKVTKPEAISNEKFVEWYDGEHIGDVLKTSGIKTAYRYKSIDPAADRPYLALYPVRDVDFLGSPEMGTIPMTSEKYFPGPSHNCKDVGSFNTRFYEFIHANEKKGANPGPGNLIISAGLTPAPGTDDDFDKWYHEEHYRTVGEVPGYVRTRRYKLKTAATETTPPPVYMVLHEFEGEELDQEALQRSGATPWAVKVMAGLTAAEVGTYKLEHQQGEIKAKF